MENCTISLPNWEPLTFLITGNSETSCGPTGRCVVNTCECDEGYSGAADVLRLEGKSCHMSSLVVTILWTIAGLLTLIFWIGSARVTWFQFKRFKDRGTTGALAYKPFRLLFPITFISFPSWIWLSLWKIANFENDKIGIDVLVTVLYSVSFLSFFYAYLDFQYQTTRTIIGSIYQGNKVTEGRRLLQRYQVNQFFGFVAYGVGRLFIFANIVMEDSAAPYVILTINIGTVVQLLSALYNAKVLLGVLLRLEGNSMLGSSDNNNSTRAKQKRTLGSRMKKRNINTLSRIEQAIQKMRQQTRNAVLAASTAVPIYTMFSIPFFWPYFSHVTAVGIILAAYVASKTALTYHFEQSSASNTAVGSAPNTPTITLDSRPMSHSVSATGSVIGSTVQGGSVSSRYSMNTDRRFSELYMSGSQVQTAPPPPQHEKIEQ